MWDEGDGAVNYIYIYRCASVCVCVHVCTFLLVLILEHRCIIQEFDLSKKIKQKISNPTFSQVSNPFLVQ